MTRLMLAVVLLASLLASCAEDNAEQSLCPIFQPGDGNGPNFPLSLGARWSYEGTLEMIDSNGSQLGDITVTISVKGRGAFRGWTYWYLEGNGFLGPLPDLMMALGDSVFAAYSSDTLLTPPVMEYEPFWQARRLSLPWLLFDFSADSGSARELFSLDWGSGSMTYTVRNYGSSPMTISGHTLAKVYRFDLEYADTWVSPNYSVRRTDQFLIAPGIGLVSHYVSRDAHGSFNSRMGESVFLKDCRVQRL